MTHIVDGLEWFRVYWIKGGVKSGSYLNAVSDPPCSGWSSAFLIPGEKTSTIFCPWTFTSYQVPAKCSELADARYTDEISVARAREILQAKWSEYQDLGLSVDYKVASQIFALLGMDAPEQTAETIELLSHSDLGPVSNLEKPVKLNSKRGKFLEWFISASKDCSILDAMSEFEMSRSNALSYLYMIRKDHGIDYQIENDIVTITLPGQCDNPFDHPWQIYTPRDL